MGKPQTPHVYGLVIFGPVQTPLLSRNFVLSQGLYTYFLIFNNLLNILVVVIILLLFTNINGNKLVQLQQMEKNCAASDILLLQQKAMLCGSLVQAPSSYCGDLWKNVTSKPSCDWPSQVVYMQDILNTLVSPNTCLNTTFAKDTHHHGNGCRRSALLVESVTLRQCL